MSMARIGGLERDRAGPRCPHEIDDVSERHVAMMGAFIVSPAKMHAQLLRRDIGKRMVEGLDMHRGALSEFRETERRILDMPAHREIGPIDLEHDAGPGDG